MHFFSTGPGETRYYLSIMAGLSSNHINTYTKGLGIDVNNPKKLTVVRVLSESILKRPADDGLKLP